MGIDAQRKLPDVLERIVKEIRDIHDGNVIRGKDLMDISIGTPGMAKMERSRSGSPRGEEVEHDAREQLRAFEMHVVRAPRDDAQA